MMHLLERSIITRVNISIKREVPMQEQIIAMISEIKDDAQLANRLNEHSSIMEDGGSTRYS